MATNHQSAGSNPAGGTGKGFQCIPCIYVLEHRNEDSENTGIKKEHLSVLFFKYRIDAGTAPAENLRGFRSPYYYNPEHMEYQIF